ncbi:hypothetical protein NQ117_12200 [Paenibacillus sp. SC116]|uniref:hypothetical protein n=1 Tax=Paenibacillus sp. SC116 TaxID=2968986 RepID=UPI00215A9477|nr:hypothetical protein [Paenibacillus sp. SC116]MCR8844447.1 hypothetical protein [Paenibacillus sp. SC116]
MGRSFANLHIKSIHLEKTIQALKEMCERHPEVLGLKSGDPSIKTVMYVSKSNDNWISVLHDYFVWGTVKKVGKTLSQLTEEPVLTAGYINEEIFELSVFKQGDIQAEKIFCEPWTRDEYGLNEECLHDNHLREVLDICTENFDDLIEITSPYKAADKLSELISMSIWCDSEWILHEEELRNRFETYEFDIENN